MAQNLQNIARELQEIKRQSVEAARSLADLEARLRGVISTAAETASKGRPVSYGKVEDITQGLLGGGMTPTGRVGVGGGTRINLSQYQKQINDLVSQYQRQVLEKSYADMKAQLLESAAATAAPTASPLIAREVQQFNNEIDRLATQSVSKKLQQQKQLLLPARAASLMEQSPLGGTVTRITGATDREIFEEGYQKLVREMNAGVKKVVDDIIERERVAAQNAAQTARSSTPVARTLQQRIGQAQQLPGTYAPGFIPPTATIGEPEPMPKGQIGKEDWFSKTLPNLKVSAEAIRQMQKQLGDLGVEYDRVVQSGVRRFGDGQLKLNATLMQNETNLGKVNFTLTKTSAVLENATVAASKFNLEMLKKDQKYGQAFAIAGQQGYSPEQLKSLTTMGGGYSKAVFEKVGQYGETQKLPIVIDSWGKAIQSTQKQFRNASDAIIRDIKEVARWSIAVSLIYLPMRKAGELIQLAIDNETKLAEISVALGGAQKDLNVIFYEAADAAQAAGESINGVLEGYSLAYRAAGSVSDQQERAVVANKLLTDSLVLSKLSSLDQAEALDILSGTLRQVSNQLNKTGREGFQPLLEGTVILDKWVAVSKTANVDLATLATAFSITSESAENAGVSIDQLNGIVGSLSEKIGGLGAKETGNAVRALIGGVYQEGAAKALQQYGISVTDTTGKMRDFLDIMTEIYNLNKAGLISDDQLNKLAYTLGGGVRRGQQYLAFLTDLKRVNEIAAESAKADGDAQQALSLKLDTVQTASTRLGNSFQKLAQSMGSDGGILDVTKLLFDTLSGILDISAKVTGVLGSASTTLAISSIAYALLLRGKPEAFQTGAMSLSQDIFSKLLPFGGRGQTPGETRFEAAAQGRTYAPGAEALPTYGQRFGTFAGKAIGQYGLGLATALPGVLSGVSEGDAGKVGASIAGALVGTMIAGPVGGLVGTMIGQAFVEQVRKSKGELDDLLTPPYLEGQTPAAGGNNLGLLRQGISPEESQRVILESYAKQFGGGTTLGSIGALGRNLAKSIFGTLPGENPNVAKNLSSYDIAETSARGIVQYYEANKGQRIYSEEDYNQAKIYVDAIDQYRKNKAQKDVTAVAPSGTRLGEVSTAYGVRYRELSNQIADMYQQRYLQQLQRGQISSKQYTTGVQETTGFSSVIPKLYTTLFTDINNKTKELNENLPEVKKNFQDIGDVIASAGPEEVQQLTSLVDEIFQLQNAVEGADGEFTTFQGQPAKVADLMEQLADRVTAAKNAFKGLQTEVNLRNIKLPSTVGLEGYTGKEYEQILSRAREMQKKYLNQVIDVNTDKFLTEDQKQTMIDRAEPLFVDLGDLLAYQLARGIIDSKFLTQAADELKKKISGFGAGTQQGGLGYQMVDYTAEQLAAIMPQYQAIRASILAKGGESKEEGLLTFFKDSTSPVYMAKDWKIVQYLLAQIADNTKKQLEGIYNLPEGSAFFVPFSAWEKFGTRGGGGGGVGNIGAGETVTSTNEEYLKKAEETRMDRIQERDKRLQAAEERPRTEPTKVSTDLDYLKQLFTGQGFRTQIPEQQKQQQAQNNFWDWMQNLWTGNAAGMVPPGSTANIEAKPVAVRVELESRTTLYLDGRVVAEAIKPYMGEALLKDDGTAGSATMKAVI